MMSRLIGGLAFPLATTLTSISEILLPTSTTQVSRGTGMLVERVLTWECKSTKPGIRKWGSSPGFAADSASLGKAVNSFKPQFAPGKRVWTADHYFSETSVRSKEDGCENTVNCSADHRAVPRCTWPKISLPFTFHFHVRDSHTCSAPLSPNVIRVGGQKWHIHKDDVKRHNFSLMLHVFKCLKRILLYL